MDAMDAGRMIMVGIAHHSERFRTPTSYMRNILHVVIMKNAVNLYMCMYMTYKYAYTYVIHFFFGGGEGGG